MARKNIDTGNTLYILPSGTILPFIPIDGSISDYFKDGVGYGDYSGWLIMNGDNDTFNMSSRYLRAHDSNGETAGSFVFKGTALPQNGFSVSNAYHRHSYSEYYLGNIDRSGTDDDDESVASRSGSNKTIEAGANDTLSFSWNNSSASTSSESHSHLLSLGGDTETRPNSLCVYFIIKS